MTNRHEVQMAARKKARELGHRLGPFEESGFTGHREARCKRNPAHWAYLKTGSALGWFAKGPAVEQRCSVGKPTVKEA